MWPRRPFLQRNPEKRPLSDAQWWHPTGLQYQPSAGGCYQSGDAPPTTGDSLITSHTTWTRTAAQQRGTKKNLLTRQTNPVSTNCQLFTKPVRLKSHRPPNTNRSKLSLWAELRLILTDSAWGEGKLRRPSDRKFTACHFKCVPVNSMGVVLLAAPLGPLLTHSRSPCQLWVPAMQNKSLKNPKLDAATNKPRVAERDCSCEVFLTEAR